MDAYRDVVESRRVGVDVPSTTCIERYQENDARSGYDFEKLLAGN